MCVISIKFHCVCAIIDSLSCSYLSLSFLSICQFIILCTMTNSNSIIFTHLLFTFYRTLYYITSHCIAVKFPRLSLCLYVYVQVVQSILTVASNCWWRPSCWCSVCLCGTLNPFLIIINAHSNLLWLPASAHPNTQMYSWSDHSNSNFLLKQIC